MGQVRKHSRYDESKPFVNLYIVVILCLVDSGSVIRSPPTKESNPCALKLSFS